MTPPKLPPELSELIEVEARKRSEGAGYVSWHNMMADYTDFANVILTHLHSQARLEFDKNAATIRAWNVFGFSGPEERPHVSDNGTKLVTEYMVEQSRWQFERDCLRIELSFKRMEWSVQKLAEANVKIEDLEAQVKELQMVCRRLTGAQTLETRDKIAAQCIELFKGNILR